MTKLVKAHFHDEHHDFEYYSCDEVDELVEKLQSALDIVLNDPGVPLRVKTVAQHALGKPLILCNEEGISAVYLQGPDYSPPEKQLVSLAELVEFMERRCVGVDKSADAARWKLIHQARAVESEKQP